MLFSKCIIIILKREDYIFNIRNNKNMINARFFPILPIIKIKKKT